MALNKTLIFTGLLVCAVFASSIALIYCRHYNRSMFVELEHLQQRTDELSIEWGRLQLEESAWSEHGRIENISRTQLKMAQPSPEKIALIKL